MYSADEEILRKKIMNMVSMLKIGEKYFIGTQFSISVGTIEQSEE